jgi:very-short-patch-repair endonuclease
MTKKHLEEAFAEQLDNAGLKYEQQFRFHPTRRWRFDFAWPKEMVAVEVQGGTWSGGRHVRGAGFELDRHKINSASILGWMVLEVTSTMIVDEVALEYLNMALLARRKD